MDEYYRKEPELQTFNEKHFDKYPFLKRTLQLVLSVSVFSFILCYSSGFPFFPDSFDMYFSTFLFSFFAHTLERKYIFLICNGILAFLAKSSVSGSTSPSSSASADADVDVSASELPEVVKESSANVNEGVHVRLPSIESSENVALDEAQDEEQEKKEKQEEQAKGAWIGEARDRESTEVSTAPDEYYSDEGEESVMVQEEDEDDMGELAEEAPPVAINEPSTDELNKKIEEFIRKMKEEIRIEAQQQLIAV